MRVCCRRARLLAVGGHHIVLRLGPRAVIVSEKIPVRSGKNHVRAEVILKIFRAARVVYMSK